VALHLQLFDEEIIQMNIGFIYCLTNRHMPGICKIGRTDRSPTQRLKELSSSTSAPVEFDIEFYVEVDNSTLMERRIHQAFDYARVNPCREFFSCAPAEAYYWLQCNADIYTDFVDGDVIFETNKLTNAAIAGKGITVAMMTDSEVDF
jgi:hypothetical protein